MSLTDQELVKQIQFESNSTAFNQLVERYQLKVLRICKGFVGQMADAEDITQDVFIEVLRSITSFRGDSQFSTWIYRIAVNKSINFLNKKKRERIFQSIEGFFQKSNDNVYNLSDEGQFAADKKIGISETRALLKRALNGLPENQRIAFILAKYQDLSYKEIAEVMGLSLSAVESLLFRAKSNLQKSILEKNRVPNASFTK